MSKNNNWPNKTPDDAVACVNRARVGSLAGDPSIDFLLTLSSEIRKWYSKVEKAIDEHPKSGTADHPRLEYC